MRRQYRQWDQEKLQDVCAGSRKTDRILFLILNIVTITQLIYTAWRKIKIHISITEKSSTILKSHHSEKTAVNISVEVPEGPPTPGHISGTNRLHGSISGSLGRVEGIAKHSQQCLQGKGCHLSSSHSERSSHPLDVGCSHVSTLHKAQGPGVSLSGRK